MIRFDTSELSSLGRELITVSAKAAPAAVSLVEDSAREVRDMWKSNATSTAGSHGRHYPNAITHEIHLNGLTIEGEIGPDSALPQGGMSFEYGSVNQPPHLDGQRAADVGEPMFARRMESLFGVIGL